MPAAIEFKRRRWADADAAGRLHFVRAERRAKHAHREELERHRRAECAQAAIT